jgi:hypothetical protein
MSPLNSSEKEAAWVKEKQEVESIRDAMGMGIDEGIKEVVIALNLLGFKTAASCEGHVDENTGHGLPFPWIDVMVDGEPEVRFENEEKIFSEVAQAHGLSVEEIKDGASHDAWMEVQHRLEKEDETQAYKNWWEENLKLEGRIRPFIEGFNKGKNVSDDVRIHVDGDRIRNGPIYKSHQEGNETQGKWIKAVQGHTLSPSELAEAKERLTARQEEMAAFMVFLKDSFFKN